MFPSIKPGQSWSMLVCVPSIRSQGLYILLHYICSKCFMHWPQFSSCWWQGESRPFYSSWGSNFSCSVTYSRDAHSFWKNPLQSVQTPISSSLPWPTFSCNIIWIYFCKVLFICSGTHWTWSINKRVMVKLHAVAPSPAFLNASNSIKRKQWLHIFSLLGLSSWHLPQGWTKNWYTSVRHYQHFFREESIEILTWKNLF